jgi:L-ascorbate metabolism protein UlaG (beta-lactamase superfamily)
MQLMPGGGEAINEERHRLALAAIGGATTVIDYGWVRFVTDPTFDPPGKFGPYRKTDSPAIAPQQLGAVDAVLLSHDLHMDNFDVTGRQFASTAPIVITGPQAARRLGANAVGLQSFDSIVIASPAKPDLKISVSAVPAVHGPLDGDRDEYGNINTEVTGFVLRGHGLPTIYVSGDNASIAPVIEIARRIGDIQIGVLHLGAARLASKNFGRPLTLTADRATDVAQLLGLSLVLPVHCEGWSLFSQGPDDVRKSFEDAGIRHLLRDTPRGFWAVHHSCETATNAKAP